MKKTSAKVGDTVRVYLKVDSPYRKKGGTVFHDGILHEVSYKKNNNPYNYLFRNGYVMLSGNYLLRFDGKWVRSTKRKIALDAILKVKVKREVAPI